MLNMNQVYSLSIRNYNVVPRSHHYCLTAHLRPKYEPELKKISVHTCGVVKKTLIDLILSIDLNKLVYSQNGCCCMYYICEVVTCPC